MLKLRSLRALAALTLLIWPIRASSIQLGLEVTPGKLEVSIPRGMTYNIPITIHNSGLNSTHVQATMVDFTVNQAGSYVFTKVGSRPNSLMKWASIRPREFNVLPNTSQQVQLTIQVPSNKALSGEYAGIVFFQTRPERKPGQTVAFSERIASKIYETIPDTVHIDGAIVRMASYANPLGRIYHVLFKNTGNAHVYLRGQLVVQTTSGAIVDHVAIPSNQLVERGGMRLLEIQGKRLPPGEYEAIATIDYNGKTDTAGGIKFSVR